MGDVETLARGDDSRLVEPRRFLIRDRQAFSAVWAAHAGPNASVPAIDFESRMVAAVFAGERPTPGFTIEVTGTRREGSSPATALVVLVDERHPDPTLVAAQVIVSPFHIVTLPRDDGDVRFNLPDPGGLQTIVFKPQPRTQTQPKTKPSFRQRPASSAEPGTGRITSVPATREETSEFTGLTPHVAASLAYLAGPFSGALLLATERENGFVRFHAWQAVVGLGMLGIAAVFFLGLAFMLLIVSPTAFWAMLWLAGATGTAWVGVWVLCLFNAYKGRVWKLPLAGDYAERHATNLRVVGAP
jgi:uncharacterized membrane protein